MEQKEMGEKKDYFVCECVGGSCKGIESSVFIGLFFHLQASHAGVCTCKHSGKMAD